MIKATELLKLTKLSIGDISNAVGYANQLHFSHLRLNADGALFPRQKSISASITQQNREIADISLKLKIRIF